MSDMRYRAHELFSTLTDDKGVEVDARFYVSADDDKGALCTYYLEAMTPKVYEAWQLENEIVNHDPDNKLVYPLIISDVLASTKGLVNVIKEMYLNNQDPKRIEQIKSHLELLRDISNEPLGEKEV